MGTVVVVLAVTSSTSRVAASAGWSLLYIAPPMEQEFIRAQRGRRKNSPER